MPRTIVLRLLAILFFAFCSLSLSLSASAQQSDLLQAEEAFRFSVERGTDGGIELNWEIAEGYYLYRDHLEAKDAANGDTVPLDTEPGVVEAEDANFGPSEVYYLETVAGLGADAPAQVAVTYQGCKKDSICYPPLTLTVDTASLQVSAPLAAALLYIAQTGDAYLGAAALFALGLGQGIPLIAFGTLGSRALPRAGAWMVQVKYAFGFVFLGAAVWMASRVLPPQATLALWAALLLTAAVFIGAADRLVSDAGTGPRFRKAAGLAVSLAGVILAIGAASGGTDPLRPLAHFSAGGSGPHVPDAEMTFVAASSTAEVERAIASADGRPTFVYFTADWCVICKAIERDVFPDTRVIAALDGFQRVKVDLTALGTANQELMRDLAVVGPPTMVFFDANAAEPSGSRLVGDTTAGTIQASVAQTVQ